MKWQFEQVAGPFSFTEGPAYDGRGVVFSDIPNSRILRYDARTGETTVFRTDTNGANGLIFDREGRLYACEGDGRRIVRYDPDEVTFVLADRFEGKRLNSPNDLAIDKEGRVWFSDPRYGDKRSDMELDHESIFRLDPRPDGSWSIRRMTYDTTRPNGLLIAPDQKTLYVAQSEYGQGRPRELRAYPIRDDDTLGPFEVLHVFYPHRGIDGMCLDVEGNIIAAAGWQESGPGPMVYVFSPGGTVLEQHPYPSDRPTNCTFGGADLQTLYVTGADGCLRAARTERQGLLLYPNADSLR
jgi:gluconolactonase